MDKALILRKGIDNNVKFSQDEINDYLRNSKLVKKLTCEFKEKPLYVIWRLIALSEIPFSNTLKYTQDLIKWVFYNLFQEEAFSFTGLREDIVPCYNAMIIEALIKLGYVNDERILKGIGWIKKHQKFERGIKTSWNKKGIFKYGGCLNATPCYIGVAKSLKALLYFQEYSNKKCEDTGIVIKKATSYILKHEFCFKLSNKSPISKHILDLSFPASYFLTSIDLLEIGYLTGTLSNLESIRMIENITKLKNNNNYGSTYQYKSDGYISFDGSKKNGDWITYLVNKYIADISR